MVAEQGIANFVASTDLTKDGNAEFYIKSLGEGSYQVRFETVVKLSYTISDNGFKFVGYACDKAEITNGEFTMPAVENVSVTAQSVAKEYTITFHANHAGSTETKTQTATYKKSTKLDENTFTRSDYIFQGWALSAVGDNNTESVKYHDNDTYIMEENYSENVDLYAVWCPEQYSLSFEGDRGLDITSVKIEVDGKVQGYAQSLPVSYGSKIRVYAIYKDGEEVKSVVANGYDFEGFKLKLGDGEFADVQAVTAEGETYYEFTFSEKSTIKLTASERNDTIYAVKYSLPEYDEDYKENYKSTIELFKTTTDTVVDYEFLIANNLIKTFPGYAFASFTGGVVISWHEGTEEDPYSTVEIRYNRLHYGLTLRSDESNGAVSFVPEDDGVENSFSTMTTKDGKEYRIYYQIPFKVRLTLKEGYMSTGFTARAYKVEGSKDFTANSKVCDYVEGNEFTVNENGDVYYGSVKILSIVDGKYYAGDLEVCDVVEGATFDTTKVDGLYYNGYAVLTKQNDGYYARTRQLLGDLTLKADGFYLGDEKLFGFVFDENDNSYKIDAMPYYAIEIAAQSAPKTYTITYHRNIDDEDTTTSSESKVFAKDMYQIKDIDANWTKDGYKFIGWALDKQNADQGLVEELYKAENLPTAEAVYMTANDIDLWAVWQAIDITYNIEYYHEKVDGSYELVDTDNTNTAHITDTVTTTPQSIENYILNNDKSVLSQVMTKDGATLKVYYDRQWFDFNVTFDANKFSSVTASVDKAAATGSDNATLDMTVSGRITGTVKFGATVNLAYSMKDGFEFTACRETSNNNVTLDLDESAQTVKFEMPTKATSIEFTATDIIYTITFVGNDGVTDDGETEYTQDWIHGETKNLEANRFKKIGYVLEYWTIGDQTYTDHASFTFEGFENLTATAKWKEADDTKYVVNYRIQKIDGTYQDLGSKDFTGTTNAQIDINKVNATLNQFEGVDIKGFTKATFDEEALIIAADGNSVFNAKFDLVGFNLSVALTKEVEDEEGKKDVAIDGVTGAEIVYSILPNGEIVEETKAVVDKEKYNILYTATVKVKFAIAEGYEISSVSITAGEIKTDLTADESGCYTFTMPTSDVLVEIVTAPKSYTLTFHKNLNGSTETQDRTYFYTETRMFDVTFSETGYKLLGWARSEDAETAEYAINENFTMSETGKLDLYGVWEANPYTIKYNPNGGEGVIENTDSSFNKVTELAGLTFTRTGYKLVSWSLKSDSLQIAEVENVSDIAEAGLYYCKADGKYYAKNLETNASGEAEVFAYWEEISYTITLVYDKVCDYADGIEFILNESGIAYNGNVVLSKEADGYYYDTVKVCDISTNEVLETKDDGLYYDNTKILSKKADGYYLEKQYQTIKYNDRLELPTAITGVEGWTKKTGYDFVGWYYFKDGEQTDIRIVRNLLTTDGGNVDIFAKWGEGVTTYTIRVVYETLDGNYSEVEGTGRYDDISLIEARTGDTVTSYQAYVSNLSHILALDLKGFAFDENKKDESTTITADGLSIVRVYMARQSYKLKLVIADNIDSVTVSTSTNTHKLVEGETNTYLIRYEDTITLTASEKAGYKDASFTVSTEDSFAGATINVNTIKMSGAENENELKKGITILASAVAKDNTKYTIKIVKEKLDGTYDSENADYTFQAQGKTDSTLTEDIVLAEIENASGLAELLKGYHKRDITFDPNDKISGSETTEVIVRYERNNHTLTIVDISEYNDAIEKLEDTLFNVAQDFKFGTAVEFTFVVNKGFAATTDMFKLYDEEGNIVDILTVEEITEGVEEGKQQFVVKFNIPDKNTYLKVYAEAKENTQYTIKVNKQKTSGNGWDTEDRTITAYGKTMTEFVQTILTKSEGYYYAFFNDAENKKAVCEVVEGNKFEVKEDGNVYYGDTKVLTKDGDAYYVFFDDEENKAEVCKASDERIFVEDNGLYYSIDVLAKVAASGISIDGFDIAKATTDMYQKDEYGNVVSKVIAGDGSTVINTYFVRETRTLKLIFVDENGNETSGLDYDNPFEDNNGKPYKVEADDVNLTESPTVQHLWTVVFGQKVKISIKLRQGFSLEQFIVGGRTQSEGVSGQTYTIASLQNNTEVTIVIKASNANYTVRYFKENLPGSETEYEKVGQDEILTGKVHTYFNAEQLEQLRANNEKDRDFEGFTFAEYKVISTYANNEPRITGDGKLVIEYYYRRVRINVDITISNTNHINAVTGAGQYAYGETVTISAEEKPGYRFVKWIIDGEDVTEKDYSFVIKKTTNIEIVVESEVGTANYTVEYYFENLDANDYLIDNDKTLTEEGTTESDINIQQYITDFDGYDFEKPENYSAYKVSGDGSTVVRLYYTLKWVNFKVNQPRGIKSIKVTGYGSDYGFEQISAEQLKFRAKFTKKINLDVELEEGYDLLGWRVGNSATYEDLLYGKVLIVKAQDFELNPTVVAKTVTIIFNPNNGSSRTVSRNTTYGSNYKLPTLSTLDFANGKQIFLGWALSEDGEVAFFDGDTITVDFDSITLYAVWREPDKTNMWLIIAIAALAVGAITFMTLAIVSKRKNSKNKKMGR